jgi:Fe-S-cluster containining protein
MDNHHEGEKSPFAVLASVPAGEFSQWLCGTQASLQSGTGQANVPCGSCKGCCRSSMFIHIKPEEIQTLQRILRTLLFPAPGLPKGHMLMGYSDRGHCPMLIDNQCSIYEYRPQTCRDYDCRVFAATGVSVDGQTQPEIAQRVREWVFNYESEESREEHRILKEAAAFLENNRALFPQGSLPGYPVQLAALAVEIYRLFSDLTATMRKDASASPDAAIAQAILTALSKSETPSESASLIQAPRSKHQRGRSGER